MTGPARLVTEVVVTEVVVTEVVATEGGAQR
jgi:hypothetical protein